MLTENFNIPNTYGVYYFKLQIQCLDILEREY